MTQPVTPLDEIEAIKRLKYRYFRLVDTANWTELADCFVESESVRYVGGSCLYDDRYVKQGGQWKIEHTGYERLYEIVEQLPAAPLVTAHYLGSHARPPNP